jgi:ribosome biogenesis GTPase
MLREATVLAIVGGRYRLYDAGEVFEASLRGRFKQASDKRVLVGDRVVVDVQDDGVATIEDVQSRHSVLKRRTPGKRRGIRNIAANIDQVVVVGSAADPSWDPHMIDRFVAVAEANSLSSLIVINKADLVQEVAQLAEPYHAAGYPVIVTSVPEHRGLDELRVKLEERVSLFSGPTGVGKSSILNALHPGLKLRTGEISARSRTGRHTTVAAEMHPFGGAGFVVDTPGLRDVGLWALGPLEVIQSFPEFARFAGQCRFDNCRHLAEPGCAVVAASQRGDFSESRLRSYRKLLEEASAAGQP